MSNSNNRPASYLTIWDVYALAAIAGRSTQATYPKTDENVIKSAVNIADKMLDLRKERANNGSV